MENSLRKNLFLGNLILKKKSSYHKKIKNSILKLKDLLNNKQQHKKLNSLVLKPRTSEKQNSGLVIVYIIYFSF